jgi:hypothetical protein
MLSGVTLFLNAVAVRCIVAAIATLRAYVVILQMILDRASIACSGILGTIERMKMKKGAVQRIDQEEF